MLEQFCEEPVYHLHEVRCVWPRFKKSEQLRLCTVMVRSVVLGHTLALLTEMDDEGRTHYDVFRYIVPDQAP